MALFGKKVSENELPNSVQDSVQNAPLDAQSSAQDSQSDLQNPVQESANDAQVLGGEELIAVITAAIAAFESSKSINNLIIRRVNREQGRVTVWSNAGRAACMRSRRV